MPHWVATTSQGAVIGLAATSGAPGVIASLPTAPDHRAYPGGPAYDWSCTAIPQVLRAADPQFQAESHLLDELRFQAHGPNTIDFAIDVVIAVDEADVLNPGPHLYDFGGAF